MTLETLDNWLVARDGKRLVYLQPLTTINKAHAISQYYGVSTSLALEVADTGLRIGRLLRTKIVGDPS